MGDLRWHLTCCIRRLNRPLPNEVIHDSVCSGGQPGAPGRGYHPAHRWAAHRTASHIQSNPSSMSAACSAHGTRFCIQGRELMSRAAARRLEGSPGGLQISTTVGAGLMWRHGRLQQLELHDRMQEPLSRSVCGSPGQAPASSSSGSLVGIGACYFLLSGAHTGVEMYGRCRGYEIPG